MEFSLEEWVSWVYTLSPVYIYTVFFLVAYLENVIPPIPGDLLVAFGGYLAAERVVGFGSLLLLTTIASVAGFMSMYAIGSYWGYRLEHGRRDFPLADRYRRKYFQRGKRWVRRWGQWVVMANRFLAGTRSVIAFTAGIYRTRIRRTILSSTISSLLWNSILLALGWVVHENWQIIGHWIGLYGWVVFGVITAVVMLWYVRNRHFRQNGGNNKKRAM